MEEKSCPWLNVEILLTVRIPPDSRTLPRKPQLTSDLRKRVG